MSCRLGTGAGPVEAGPAEVKLQLKVPRAGARPARGGLLCAPDSGRGHPHCRPTGRGPRLPLAPSSRHISGNTEIFKCIQVLEESSVMQLQYSP